MHSAVVEIIALPGSKVQYITLQNWASNIYNLVWHPVFKAFASSKVSEYVKNLLPLRLSYTLFSEEYNPWLKIMGDVSASVKVTRTQIDPNNYFLKLQQQYSDEIVKILQSYSRQVSMYQENTFFDMWTHPAVQKLWGTDKEEPRLTPSMIQTDRNLIVQNALQRIQSHLEVKNNVEALYRIVRLVIDFRKRKVVPEPLVRALVAEAKKLQPELSDGKIHEIVRNQALVVSHDPEAAIVALKNYFNQNKHGIKVINIIHEIRDSLGGISQEDVKEAVDKLVQILKKTGKS